MRAKHYAIGTAWIVGVGLLLLLLSWVGVVDDGISWGCFWIAIAATLIAWFHIWSTQPPAPVKYTPDQSRQFVAEYTRRLDAGEEPRWELLLARGMWWQWLGKWSESVTDLTEALELSSSDEVQIRLRRADAFYYLERYSEAVDDLSFGIERLREGAIGNENLADALYSRACAWEFLGEFASAISDVDEIASLGQIKAEHLVVRGQALIHCLEFQRALDDFRKAVKLDPKSGNAWNGIAHVLATAPEDKLRDGTEAVRCAQRACELTGWSLWHPLSTLAAAWAECGDFEKAVEYAEQALELATDSEKAERLERIEQYRRGLPYRHDRTSHIRRGDKR